MQNKILIKTSDEMKEKIDISKEAIIQLL